MLDKRAQGRPARGADTVGPKKIVEGMQEALRSLQVSDVKRKDIAHFAGVTPALVTYYFPERNTLIEAATAPVVESLVAAVREKMSCSIDPNYTLIQIIYDIVACYSKNITIIELYIMHKKSPDGKSTQDVLQEMADVIAEFFDEWLLRLSDCIYNGRFLTNAMLGMCRAVAYHHQMDIDGDEGRDGTLVHARMIYRVMAGGLHGHPLQGIDEFASENEPDRNERGLPASASWMAHAAPRES